MTEHNLFSYPYASFTNEQLTLLKVAALTSTNWCCSIRSVRAGTPSARAPSRSKAAESGCCPRVLLPRR